MASRKKSSHRQSCVCMEGKLRGRITSSRWQKMLNIFTYQEASGKLRVPGYIQIWFSKARLNKGFFRTQSSHSSKGAASAPSAAAMSSQAQSPPPSRGGRIWNSTVME